MDARFGCRAVVALATDFHGKDWGTFKEPHAGMKANVVRCIGTKCLTVGEMHMEACAIRVGPSLSGALRICP